MTEVEKAITVAEAMKSFPKVASATTRETVRTCIRAFSEEADRAEQEGCSGWERKKRAMMAYKLAMPVMDSRGAVLAYIACVAQGINLKVFSGRDGSQMLYAAQVALSLLREQKPAGRPQRRTARQKAKAA
jgi:DNA-binding IclR family transcriptional regulator